MAESRTQEIEASKGNGSWEKSFLERHGYSKTITSKSGRYRTRKLSKVSIWDTQWNIPRRSSESTVRPTAEPRFFYPQDPPKPRPVSSTTQAQSQHNSIEEESRKSQHGDSGSHSAAPPKYTASNPWHRPSWTESHQSSHKNYFTPSVAASESFEQFLERRRKEEEQRRYPPPSERSKQRSFSEIPLDSKSYVSTDVIYLSSNDQNDSSVYRL